MCQAQVRYGEAEGLLRRALQIREVKLGHNHRKTASTLNDLAWVLRDQGRYAKAEPLSRRALTIREKEYGPDHPATAASLIDLARVRKAQGWYWEAEQLLCRALQIREAKLVPDHLETAYSLDNLAGVLWRQGRYTEAKPRVERALGIFRKFLGDEHPSTIQAREQLRELEESIRKSESSHASGGKMIKVLFLAANPAGTSQLALDEEIRAIDAKIRGSEHRDRLTMVSHWAVRLDDLSGLLMRQRPEIVHFSGHGAASGAIVLVGADGTPKTVPPEALAGMFRVLKDNVRVVVLNACYSGCRPRRSSRRSTAPSG